MTNYAWSSYARLLPQDMVITPCAEQIPMLDKFMHSSEPDVEALVENFSLQPVPDYGDWR